MTKQPLSDFLKWIEECIAWEEKGTYDKYKSVDECREHILQVWYEFLFPEEYKEANSWKVKMAQDLLKATAWLSTIKY